LVPKRCIRRGAHALRLAAPPARARTSGSHLGVETNRFYAALRVCVAESPRFVIATLARKLIEVARPLGDEYQ